MRHSISRKNFARCLRTFFVTGLVVGTVGCTQGLEPTPPGTSKAPPPGETQWPKPEIPPNLLAPTVEIVSPANASVVDSETVIIRGTAMDDAGLATVFVQVGNNSPVLAQSPDSFRHWELEALIPHGVFEVRAWAYDRDGRRSEEDARITLERLGQAADALAPTVEIQAPEDGTSPLHTVVVLQGLTADDRGVVRMELTINGEPQTERAFETHDQFASWSRVTALIPGVENVLVVRAYDNAGNIGTAQITLNAKAQDDKQAPSLTLLSPGNGESVNTGSLLVRGNAHDNLAIREVKVRSAAPVNDSCSQVRWSPYVFATTTDAFETFEAPLSIPRGALCLEARAIDISGLSTSVIHRITNNFIADWSEDTSFLMRLHKLDTKPKVRLELTRAGISEIMNEQIQRDLTIAELDLDPVLRSALNSIKNACGVCWQNREPTPSEGNYRCNNNTSNYDCSRTDLGCSFGSGPNCSGWQNSPEYALVRLLTMTPHNANIQGSSLGKMEGVVTSMRKYIGTMSFPELLSDALAIHQHREFVPTNAVVPALMDNLISTHPGFVDHGDGPLLPVTLYDALRDLAPLSDVLGPAPNGHPGVADPSFPIHGVVFPMDTFRMILVAESNLRWHDGLQLGAGKNYISTIFDDVGPTFDDIVEFDFFNPETFSIVGLPAMPTVDLRFSLYESPRNIPVCSGSACKSHFPDTPRSNYVWDLPPWMLEHVLAKAAYNSFSSPPLHTYKAYEVFLLGKLAEIFVGNAGGRQSNPAGWLTMKMGTIAGWLAGDPPPDQYIWEAIMDIAEVVGHRNVKPNRPSPACPNLGNGENEYTICEGDLNPKFTLYGVETGVTAAALAAASRDQLHAQRQVLTQRLLGGFEENNGCIDVYYVERNGQRMLWETIAGDPVPSTCTAQARGGFFADAELTQKVSTPSVPGVPASAHEKWVVEPGEHVLYKRGNDGHIWRLMLHVPSQASGDHEITVRVAHKL